MVHKRPLIMKKMLRYVLCLFACMLLAQCATKTKIEYRDRYISKIVYDTLIDKSTDSTFVYVTTKGDTVYKNVYKERTRWRDRIIERRDTFWRDSVVTEYKEMTKTVTKTPKIYKLSLWFSIICIIFALVKLIKFLRRWFKIL